MQITQQLVSGSARRVGKGINPKRYITIHMTANYARGATAQAHANLLSRGVDGLKSWHYTTDDVAIFQSYPDDAICWHAGDDLGPGNTQSIGIEIAVNAGGNLALAVANAAWLTRELMRLHNIPLSNVVQHNRWSGKNCPRELRDGSRGISWADFLAMVSNAKPSSAPVDTLKDDGIFGKLTITKTQTDAGLIVDGEVWNQSRSMKSRVPGLTSGWVWSHTSLGSAVRAGGSPTWGFIQAKVLNLSGSRLDNVLGPKDINDFIAAMGYRPDGKLDYPSKSVAEFQRRLNRGDYRA